ncbi:MAG: histidinol dehydrogenase, partial [Chitinophagaceae bacterium]|nr:histidinol dehydrogenase [Chitinophagaceae bacterium]
MLSTILYPEVATWPSLLQRPVSDPTRLFDQVREIMEEVKAGGDAAVRRLTKEFDGATLDDFSINQQTVAA